ncbi:hypothetical protein HDR66_03670 [bacterium]|nr:hypothetical protein [bacterium]
MKKFLLIGALAVLSACGEVDNSPTYVQSAKTDVGNAIVANVIRNTHFKCFSIQDEPTQVWTMACFMDNDSNPSPILLYAIYEQPTNINPPFAYRLVALNGKAIQYADIPALRMFKIERENDNPLSARISDIIDVYKNQYAAK